MKLKKKYKNLLTIIIPRHVHRVKEIIPEIEKLNLKVLSHSKKSNNLKNVDIYIVDTFGETRKFHEIASSVFLGGSFIKRGGQNPLEAARYGAKILHGPNIDNFKDIYKLLRSLKISKKLILQSNYLHQLYFQKINILGEDKKYWRKILKTIKELDNLLKMNLKKPKFWDYKKPNLYAYLLSPIAFLIKIINTFLKKLR